ncbi:MAG: phage baseplate assembly protein V [Blastocatellia bacterium]|nr:phage baseplate assembly protein V [Blastocatellia bacterium]
MQQLFFGKYRGTVVDNNDPMFLGRVKVSCPSVLVGSEDHWAMPSVPYAGNGVGWYAIPPTDANVWVEFEGGDLGLPIWSGCFWTRQSELPGKQGTPPTPSTKVFKTDAATITLDDSAGASGVTIETNNGMKIAITSQGIEIDDGQGAKIKLSGPTVSINDTALEVT